MGRCGWQLYIFPLLVGPKMDYKKQNKTNVPKDLKRRGILPPRRSLREILQQGAESSGVTARDPLANSEPDAVISAKGRNEPLVRNLPEVELGTSLSGTGGINTSLQEAGSAGIPAAEGDQGRLIPSMGEFRLAKKELSGSARRKLKKSQSQVKRGRNWGFQLPGIAA
jgi:hypothetical protein